MTRRLSATERKVTPVRRLNAPFDLCEFPRFGTRKEGRAANPYRVGDVVWSKTGRPALVVGVFVDRVNERDPSSTLLPVVRVRPETAKGEWSETWVYMWPGDLDRGHAAAAAQGGGGQT